MIDATHAPHALAIPCEACGGSEDCRGVFCGQQTREEVIDMCPPRVQRDEKAGGE